MLLNLLPDFKTLQPKEIPYQLQTLFEKHKKRLDEIVKTAQDVPTWENLMFPLENMADEWHKAFGPFAHLNGVVNSPEVREAYTACLPILTEYSLAFAHHEGLYQAVQKLHDSSEFAAMSATRQKIIRDELLEFKLSGIALPLDKKARFKEIQEELSTLSNQFENHMLDATAAWSKHIVDEKDVAGIPAHTLKAAFEKAQKQFPENKNSGWVFSLEPPVYLDIMMYADNRVLREEIYHAYVTRASDRSPSGMAWDNGPVIEKILKCRHEEAQLLGYENYAALSLARKMAENVPQVFEFLNNLGIKAKPQATQELSALTQFAHKHLGLEILNPWDIAYASEKRREVEYAISQNELRIYFPHTVVLNGLFEIVQKLYGMRFEEVENASVWHSDVKLYAMYQEKAIRGYVYIDLFARSTKRGGAWMDNCVGRQYLADGSLQNPAAYLTCNFTPPENAEKPAFLSHDEVVTLFHEFGHTLHHILTQVSDASAAGIEGVEWDAVEMPSQFFEHWCWHKESLALISSHWETKQALPEDLIEKMLKAKNFQSGLHLVRQLEFSLFDFHIHADFNTQTFEGMPWVQKVLNEVRAQVCVVPIVEYNRFPNGFSHIFAGGYGAGYYSYLWAEVLSSDAFVAFEENGIFDESTGRRFLHEVLEVGSSRPMLASFEAFLGRKPTIDALLRHLGIHMECKNV